MYQKLTRLQSFIEYLRGLEEPAKRTWVYIFSGITIMFVGAAWIIYLNFTLASVPPKSSFLKSPEGTVAETEVATAHPILANFKNNVSTIRKNVSSWLMGLVNKKNEIIIETSD